MAELTAGNLANLVNGLEPDTAIWVKVRNPRTGKFKAYRAARVEVLNDGMSKKWSYAIVADYPPLPTSGGRDD